MIVCRKVQYQMKPFCCQHREQYISEQNHEITVGILLWRKFIFPNYNYKNGPLYLLLPFYKNIYCIWDLYLGWFLQGPRNLNLIKIDEFSANTVLYCINPTVKSKNLFWKHLLIKIKFLLSRNRDEQEQEMYVNYGFLYLFLTTDTNLLFLCREAAFLLVLYWCRQP